jgi:uncharacterized membrane protein YfcA
MTRSLLLQLLVLSIAWLSATYGIWYSKEIEFEKALFSSIITTIGLLVGILLAIADHRSKTRSQKESKT